MLDHVRHEDGGHLFIIKGGTAMQLRLGIHARATTDIDIVFADNVDEWFVRFDDAISMSGRPRSRHYHHGNVTSHCSLQSILTVPKRAGDAVDYLERLIARIDQSS